MIDEWTRGDDDHRLTLERSFIASGDLAAIVRPFPPPVGGYSWEAWPDEKDCSIYGCGRARTEREATDAADACLGVVRVGNLYELSHGADVAATALVADAPMYMPGMVRLWLIGAAPCVMQVVDLALLKDKDFRLVKMGDRPDVK